ncbi:NIL domain protein [Bordetella holmesii 04P3421]|nr:NIL domain protein [Bordetella holmesii 04P3421]
MLPHGQVVEMGRTQDVFASPKHDVTRAMVSAATASELSEGTLAAVRERIATHTSAQPGRAARLWRLSLTGKDAGGALVSDLARDHALDISLIQARVDDIQGVAVGTLFVLALGAAQAIEGALAALAAHDITIEEIAHESATD